MSERLTDELLNKMHACAPLLPPPGDTELRKVIDEVRRERSKRRHFSNALTWIEENHPGGLVLVARALVATADTPTEADETPLGTMENPITCGGSDRRGKWCRCTKCSTLAQCTPDFDFWTDTRASELPPGSAPEGNGALYCESCADALIPEGMKVLDDRPKTKEPADA